MIHVNNKRKYEVIIIKNAYDLEQLNKDYYEALKKTGQVLNYDGIGDIPFWNLHIALEIVSAFAGLEYLYFKREDHFEVIKLLPK